MCAEVITYDTFIFKINFYFNCREVYKSSYTCNVLVYELSCHRNLVQGCSTYKCRKLLINVQFFNPFYHRRRHAEASWGTGPGWKRRGWRGVVPRLVPRVEKYWYFNITSRLPEAECAPSRDHRAPAVHRLAPKAGAATA